MKLDIPEIKERHTLINLLETKKISQAEFDNHNQILLDTINKKVRDCLDNVGPKIVAIKKEVKKNKKSKRQIYKDVRQLYSDTRDCFQTVQKFKQALYYEFNKK